MIKYGYHAGTNVTIRRLMTTSMTLLFIIVSILPLLFIAINFSFAPHNPYQEKYSIFECGYHGFL
jgi:NADH-ubiquinone oxidoreductase chain 3